MGLDFEYSDGQTPIDDDEREGLLIHSITKRGELDEYEQLNIEDAIKWTISRTFTVEKILREDFVRELHHRMFGNTCRWAGQSRTSNKNLGIDKLMIAVELKNLFDDCMHWITNSVFPPDEIAVRFSHRIVSIHPFPNGNGRHSRLMADVIITHGFDRPVFTWGSTTLTKPGEARKKYLAALKEADGGNYEPLIVFARD
ncbi:MAG: mobile mystery protein B [Ignavibacteriales bacterium]|nr:mobile mystery protein B [Ignavibacteriales bacterium]